MFPAPRSSGTSSLVMLLLRRINFYSLCFAFGLSVLLILAGSRYTVNTPDSRRNIRNFLKVDDSAVTTNLYDGSSNIDRILEKTRSKIKLNLKKYNFTYSGVQRLEDLVMETGGQPLKSIIVSTWRSGTTFLGEVLNSVPGNFYNYEPLLKYGIIQIRGPPHAENAMNTIKNMLRCNYNDMDDYFEYGKTHLYQFNHNTRLWDHCKFKKELCFDANFTSKFCKLFPFQSMKVVRVRLRLVKELLEDKELNVKVVLLVRDPRGVMKSRQHRDFCQPAPDCWQPELLCADMISDYVAAAQLQKEFPDKLMVLRYEELALNPIVRTRMLLKWLRISPLPEVDAFLNTHTNAAAGGASSTFRVSREVPFRWKYISDFNYVDSVQIACKEALNLWGYAMAHNATHMASKDFDPLLQYTVEL